MSKPESDSDPKPVSDIHDKSSAPLHQLTRFHDNMAINTEVLVNVALDFMDDDADSDNATPYGMYFGNESPINEN